MMDKLIADLEKIDWKNFSFARTHANLAFNKKQLLEKLYEINRHIPHEFVQKYADELCEYSDNLLFSENRKIFNLIRHGKDYGKYKVNFFHSEWEKNDFTYLVDFPLQSSNRQHTFSLDLILFVNYLPLVVIVNRENKLKSFSAVEDYQKYLPQLYKYNFFSILRTSTNDFVGVITDEIHNYLAWRPSTQQLLLPKNLLSVFTNYITFHLGAKRKVMARYYQYSCTEKILTLIKEGSEKGGVIWHTTGSGKSLTMVFTVARILIDYPQSTIFLITDRQELDRQLYGFFTEFSSLLISENIIKVSKIEELINRLKKTNQGKVIFIIIHKFQPSKFQDCLSKFKNPHGIFVFVDEAHRSQNLKTGFAHIMRQVIPEAHFFAWTGTPISTEEKSTYIEFGTSLDPLHTYSTKEARDDQIIVSDIYYEPYPVINLSAMVNKIKTDYESLMSRKNMPPKFLVMLNQQKQAKELYELFRQEEEYRETVCLIISEASDREVMTRKFKNNIRPNIAIVVNMLTTGFDLPTLRAIYIGQKIKSASDFWQKISRVNRLATDKTVGHIIDFVNNSLTLSEAKRKYFGDENLPLNSPMEAIADCLKKLKQIINYQWKSSPEAAIGYLLRNKKEKEFIRLTKKIEEIAISATEQIKDEEKDFFSNCQKIVAHFAQSSDTLLIRDKPKNLPTNKAHNEEAKELVTKYIYDEDYYYLLSLVEKLKKLQTEFLKWNIPRKVLENLGKLINEYEERDPVKFDFLDFCQKTEVNWKIMKDKYDEIQVNCQKDPNYLMKKNLQDHLQTNFSDFFLATKTKLDNFLEELAKVFSEKFHNDPDWFLISKTYNFNELERLFEKIYFEVYKTSSLNNLEERQKIRKNIINIITKSFYD